MHSAAKNSSKGSQTRERLIAVAARMFIKNGYYATGISEIIEEAKVSKGSFYFYFKSKKELALEVYKYFNRKTLDVLRQIAEKADWEEFVDKLLEWILAKSAGRKNYGCPFAVLGAESAFSDPDLSALYYASILEGVLVFKKSLLNSGLMEAAAALKAERAFSLYEGYMLRYRLGKNQEEFNRLGSALRNI
jgi:AcrR family transcriptional regulator